MSKKIKEDELNKANGGKMDNFSEIYCTKCMKTFDASEAASRSVGSGCSKHPEYQCPTCKSWMKE